MTHKRIIEASAPGTLFLMGEHAVLHGHRAITAAVDQRLNVRMESRFDHKVIINSVLGIYESDLKNLVDDDRFRFILSAIKEYQSELEGGFELTIASSFSHKVGLGSSAAVTVAVCGALHQWVHGDYSLADIFKSAITVMRDVQDGKGSGADIAACIHGGVVAYRVDPLQIQPLKGVPQIQLFFSGYKMKTPDVIAKVNAAGSSQQHTYQQLYNLMGEVTDQAIGAIDTENWSQFGQLMNTYQGLMDALGVCDRTLANMIYGLREKGALGAKISGSGLGDCVYSLQTTIHSSQFEYECIPVKLSALGLDVETIK